LNCHTLFETSFWKPAKILCGHLISYFRLSRPQVCIFAYGQTGSGKTHTMLGVPQPSEARGMIPRSLEQIFQASQHLAAQVRPTKQQTELD
jgi:hypothetical protein